MNECNGCLDDLEPLEMQVVENEERSKEENGEHRIPSSVPDKQASVRISSKTGKTKILLHLPFIISPHSKYRRGSSNSFESVAWCRCRDTVFEKPSEVRLHFFWNESRKLAMIVLSVQLTSMPLDKKEATTRIIRGHR